MNYQGTLSLWETQFFTPLYQPLEGNLTVDVCIVGAGMAGLTAAYQLIKQGLSVAIVERGSINGGESAHTTAHLSYLLDRRFYELKSLFGTYKTTLALQSHQGAIDFIESVAHNEGISCGFKRVGAYLYATSKEQQESLLKEEKMCRELGLNDIHLVDTPSWVPVPYGPALYFPNNAQFEPLQYLSQLAKIVMQKGGQIFTQTAATEIVEDPVPVVKTENGFEITCGSVLLTSFSPCIRNLKIDLKQAAYRSYVIAGKVPPDFLPSALYYDMEDPYHYVRTYEDAQGRWLIIGGEDHRTGQKEHPEECFLALEQWANVRFPELTEISYRWSGQVLEPVDGLAFIGQMPAQKQIYLATGFSGNGMTYGTIAGQLLADLVLKKPNHWAEVYHPSHLSLKALPKMIAEDCHTFLQYGKWLTKGDVDDESAIPLGSGAIVRKGLIKQAVYRDNQGVFHRYKAVCPHLYAQVKWNEVEKAWECPAHGSRFNCYGHVLTCPANKDLEPVVDNS